jgi:hypothetical protein
VTPGRAAFPAPAMLATVATSAQWQALSDRRAAARACWFAARACADAATALAQSPPAEAAAAARRAADDLQAVVATLQRIGGPAVSPDAWP